MAKSTPAHIRASNKYRDKNYKRLEIICRPEQAEALKSAAKAAGLTVTQLVLSRCLPDQQITTADDGGTE